LLTIALTSLQHHYPDVEGKWGKRADVVGIVGSQTCLFLTLWGKINQNQKIGNHHAMLIAIQHGVMIPNLGIGHEPDFCLLLNIWG
jgi:hypothetical protein